METSAHYSNLNYSSPRAVAMVLALVSAILLSPLYVDSRKSERHLEARWSSSGLVVPAVVAGLIVAIKTSINGGQRRASGFESSENNAAGLVLRIGSSSWGLAGILVMLLFVVSWQNSVKHFFWR